jgi:hemerythrin superfamily protein
MSDEPTTQTATDMLRGQHAVVKDMFEQMDQLQGNDRVELFDCLRATIAIHETAEEEIVHPAARRISETAEKVVDARLREEDEAKKVLANLEKIGVGGENFDEIFSSFRSSVLDHAEAEETEVFALLDAHLDPSELRDMADAIALAERMAPTHAHPHAPESAIGNAIVGPFVALVDSVRDKLREHKRHASEQ